MTHENYLKNMRAIDKAHKKALRKLWAKIFKYEQIYKIGDVVPVRVPTNKQDDRTAPIISVIISSIDKGAFWRDAKPDFGYHGYEILRDGQLTYTGRLIAIYHSEIIKESKK